MSAPMKLALDGGQPFRTAPFPPRTPYDDEEVALVTEAIRSQNLFYVGGTKVAALEKAFAEFYGVRHAVGVSSGTAAIHVAIGTVNPSPGDEIITAPITDGGTIAPILYQGAIPIFADVDDTYNMDPADVERKITDRTAAILVVHLGGTGANIEALTDIARRHNIPLIEDVSQTHATKFKGRWLGTWGDIAAFSFQQSKHMTTGDGGMTITNRDDWAERMILFHDKGWDRKMGFGRGRRSYRMLAPNYRMTELQGAVGLAQIKKVRRVVEKRMALGDYLSALIGEVDGVTPPRRHDGCEHSYWLYPMRVEGWSAARFAEALTKEGVPAGAGYIGEPIFLCMDALVNGRTFGNSSYPFDGHYGRKVEYKQGMCPRTEDALRHMALVSFNDNFTRKDIEDMAGAIRKVAELLPKDA